MQDGFSNPLKPKRNTKMSNKHEIKKSLKNLIDDDREFVAMLSGEWGIGKTYFWHEFTENNLKGKDVVYISLFGKNSLADIEAEIVTKLYKYNKSLNKYSKHLDRVGNMASTAVGLPINVSMGSILSLFKASDFKNTIICFDDFERLSDKVPLRDVMGLISQFKEQKKCKVIMILNEKELDKLSDIDGKKHDEIFALYKEKVVDYNFHYMPSQEELFEAIKEDLKKINFCEHQTIYDFFKKINLKNIRIMKQALYQLNHFYFIKKYGLDEKVISEFVEITLNLFVFKALSNYSYSDFEELKQYDAEKKMQFALKDENFKENEKYEKVSHYYYSDDSHISKEYQSINQDIIEKIIYGFIDSHSLTEEDIQTQLEKNNKSLYLYTIRNEISELNTRLYIDFSVPNNKIAKQLFDLLNEHKDNMHRLFQYSNYKPFIENINKFLSEITTKSLEKEIAKNYIEFYMDNPNYDISGPFDKKEGQSSLLILSYAWAKTYINDYRDKQKITSKEALPIIEAILDRRFLSDEDIFKLNQLKMKDFKKQIKENSDFIQPLIKFLNMNDFKVVNISGSEKEVKEKIINALQALDKESDDYTWKVDKILKSAGIKTEENK